MRTVCRLYFLYLLLLLFSAGCQSTYPIRKGSRAKDFTLDCLEGGKRTLSALNKDKVVLMCFWASWCPSCRSEVGALNALHAKYKERGLVVAGINYTESREAALLAKEKLGIRYPVLLDADGRILDTVYKLDGIPTVILVDKKGVVRFMGDDVPRDKEIEKWLEPF